MPPSPRPVSRPSAKTHGAVERNVKRRHSRLIDGLARPLNEWFGQTAELKQRHMQTIARSQLALKFVSARDDLCHPISPADVSVSGRTARNSRLV
jgi:hypothetical protein